MNSLKKLLQGTSIELVGDPDNVKTIDPKLHDVGIGSKGLRYGDYSDRTNGGPILGERVTFNANDTAKPAFEYGSNIGRNTIDFFVRGGTSYAVPRMTALIARYLLKHLQS